MNQAAGLRLSVSTHERGQHSANLENIAAGDIIVVEEIALEKIGINILLSGSNIETARCLANKIMTLISEKLFAIELWCRARIPRRKIRTLVRAC